MKKEKFVNALADLVDDALSRAGSKPKHISREEIASELQGASFRVIPTSPAAQTSIQHLGAALDRTPAGGQVILIVVDNDCKGFVTTELHGDPIVALRRAGQQFFQYEENHILKKTLEGDRKAAVNRDMGEMCFRVIGEAIPAPPTAERTPGLEGWRGEVAQEAAGEAQGHVVAPPGALMASVQPKVLLRGIYEAVEAGTPLLATNFQPDARIALNVLVAMGYASLDDVSDKLGITTSGREALGIRPAGVIDLPVEVAEITGNVTESELVARYAESKIAAIDHAITLGNAPEYEMQCSWQESYQHAAIILRQMAAEFRQGLHLPSVHIDGRVIPYNEDRSTGLIHATNLRTFFTDAYERNLKAGWWTEITTGQPKKRNVGELFMLMVTELAEAYDAYVRGSADDKLPQYPGVGVEMGDLLIRVADFCGAMAAGNIVTYTNTRNPGDAMFVEVAAIADRYEAIRKTPEALGDPEAGDLLSAQDVAVMVDAKLAFNAKRPDHKIENRLKDGGKQT